VRLWQKRTKLAAGWSRMVRIGADQIAAAIGSR
jgi:hypothetical protein